MDTAVPAIMGALAVLFGQWLDKVTTDRPYLRGFAVGALLAMIILASIKTISE